MDLVKTTLQILKKLHVEDVVVCAGARNIPIVYGLEQENFNIISYFEERSAAFYALGRSKFLNKPVAIVTTSGTAAVELFPAITEAYYQDIPLLAITADRPKFYRGSGAPQAIDQTELYKKYVESSWDWDVHQKDFSIVCSGKKPLHFNLCFEEPLIDGEYPDQISGSLNVQFKNSLSPSLQSTSLAGLHPLVIVSDLNVTERATVVQFLKKYKLTFYAEFLSGLMNRTDLKSQQIMNLEGFVNLAVKYKFDSIIRLGGVPTHRLWRDLEVKYQHLPVFNFSARSFSGLARETKLYPLSLLPDLKMDVDQNFDTSLIQNRESQLENFKLHSLQKYHDSEPSFVRCLSEMIDQDPLYIGNSLPIREWDLFSSVEQKRQEVFAHRGVNGIDGQISGYLGWSQNFSVSWCLVGDLTALYDLSSLGLVAESKSKKRIVIMNNSGGKIFNRLFKEKKYLNSQKVDFSAWARLWGWDYLGISKTQDFKQLFLLQKDRVIIELMPDNAQSDLFWQEWDVFCQS